jgi:intracellular septation protein
VSQGRKLAIEMGPLLAFFITNWKAGIFWATGVFMAATVAALIVSYLLTGKIAKFPLFSAIFVGIFGGLTLYFQSDIFIKVKVTLINLFLGFSLLGGLLFNRYFLKFIMGEVLDMPASAWRTLTIRWGIFFIAVAVLNEVVWRNVSNDMWVNFKVFGLLGLTVLFAFANAPFMAQYMETGEDKGKPSAD